jgi:triacylglycerol lipase
MVAARVASVGSSALASIRSGVASAPKLAGGALVEIGWVAAHALIYPLGLLRETRDVFDPQRLNVRDLPPAQRGLFYADVAAAGSPILFVHGIVDNRTIFAPMRRGLRRRGFGRLHTFSYGPASSDVRTTAARLGGVIEALCEETGHERIHVVGHSLGGLITRYYVQRMGGDAHVDTLITLGSPHSGTHAARLLPIPLVKQLRPGSDLMNELALPAPGCSTRFVAYWSDLDQLIVPKRNARLDHPDLEVRNVLVRGIGHLSLPINGGIVHEISNVLAHLESGDTHDLDDVLAGREAADLLGEDSAESFDPLPDVIPSHQGRPRLGT